MAQYGEERRIPMRYEDIPQVVWRAVSSNWQNNDTVASFSTSRTFITANSLLRFETVKRSLLSFDSIWPAWYELEEYSIIWNVLACRAIAFN